MIKKMLGLVLLAGNAVWADTHYVDQNSPSPTAPYTSWATASHTIQAAVDVAVAGDEVLVADGLYNSGSRVAPGQVLCGNRVVIDKAVTVRSVNGAESTIIEGRGPRGDTAIRGVWMADGALLDGFTVTNGHTTIIGTSEDRGGGICCKSTKARVENSILAGNSAWYGGGANYGTLNNCKISGNSVTYGGGAAYGGTLNNCMISGNSAGHSGGGVREGTLNNCTISGNLSSDYGGGAYECTLNNCAISGNSAAYDGGGAKRGTLNNCTIIGNSAGSLGGGASSCTLNNCTIIGNVASSLGGGVCGGSVRNSIIYGNSKENASAGTAISICYTNDPSFVSASTGNYRLAADSPCRDAGLNGFVTTTLDLDGNPRIVNGTVDIGAYEYQGADLYFITASAGSHGRVAPTGKVNALAGTNITFSITPDAYYRTAEILTNGVSLGASGASSFTWQNIRGDGVLEVTFEAKTATNNVPQWWLAQYGWTSGFDAAALADTDGDGYCAWQEYVLGCNPTDFSSTLVFGATLNGAAYRLDFLAVAGRIYTVEYANSLTGGQWNEYLRLVGATGPVSLNDNTATSNRFYRMKVEWAK